jgi:hypothetical protein
MFRWFVVAALSLAAGTALAQETSFSLINETDQPIKALYVSPNDLNMWGPDILGNVIQIGQSRQVRFKQSPDVCISDLMAVFVDGTSKAVWQNFNLCQVTEMRLRYDRYSGVATAQYN